MKSGLGLALVVILTATGCASAVGAGGAPVDAEGDREETVESTASALVVCPDEGTPLALVTRPMDQAIEDARLAFNAAEVNGGSWRSVTGVSLFRYSKCVSPSPTLADLEAELPSDVQQTIGGLRGADTLDRTGVEADRFLSGPNGSVTLAAIDTWAGGSIRNRSRVEAQVHWDEVPCHNCTDHAAVVVLHYPHRRKVIVIYASYGWDS